MTVRVAALGLSAFACALTAGCGSPSAPTPTQRPSVRPSATATATPIPSGPYAVVVTNAPRQGSTYDVLLVDAQAQVVARVTARLPLLKPNQSVELPLVSASNDLVYYLDGDTDIHSLAPSGATTLVKTVAAGAASILGFAVSPDDQSVAVTLINQSADPTKDTGHGYVEDLHDSSNHVELFSNSGTDAIRFPVGWHGTDIVDGVGNQCYAGYGQQPTSTDLCSPQSYHVLSSTTGARAATVCESPAPPPANETVNDFPSGLPVAGGTACVESEYYSSGTGTAQTKVIAVDWSDHEHTVVSPDSSGNLQYQDCFLSPGGTQVACTANSSQSLTIFATGAAPHDLGRRYTVLGWLDDSHLMVDIDSSTLAVLTAATGTTVTLSLGGADKTGMQAVQPGGL